MKITYTGSVDDLLPKQRTKLEAKLDKLSKVVERKGEKEIHVILSKTRHLHKAEITLNAFDHSIIGAGSDGDLSIAMATAIDNLEKQILKLRAKWRDSRGHDTIRQASEAIEPPAPVAKKAAAPAKKKAAKPAVAVEPVKARTKVFRVNHQDGRKPMTLEEAMLELGDAQDYLVYRDTKTDRVCTLLRRADGHLDLIES